MSIGPLIATLQKATGIREDFVRIALLFIFNLILSPLFHILKQPNQRLIFSGVTGLVFLYVMLEEWAVYVIGSAVTSYAVISQFRHSQLAVSVFLAFGFLLFIHYYRSVYDYESWKLDCSVPQMFLTTKIVYFGHYINKKGRHTFLEFLSYVFFFPSVIIGPTFSFETFMAFIQRQNQYASNIPIPYKKLGIYLAKGLFMSLITVFFVPLLPADWFGTSPYFLESSLPFKLLIMTTIPIIYRIKFYSGWAFTQAAVDLSGLSYDKNGTFNEVHIGSERYQLEHNPRVKTESWNSSIQLWLKSCIYDPLTAQKSINPTLAVFMVSAFWHGIYLTYYLGFVQWALVTTISRFIYKASLSFGKAAEKKWVTVLAWLSSNIAMNWTALFMVVLDWNKAINFYNSMHWLGTVIFLAIYAFFTLTGWRQRTKKADNQAKSN